MSARDVVGLLRLGGGESSVVIKIQGKLKKSCSLEAIRVEIENILRECGLRVTQFSARKVRKKGKKKKT
jgi:hypothetical protein